MTKLVRNIVLAALCSLATHSATAQQDADKTWAAIRSATPPRPEVFPLYGQDPIPNAKPAPDQETGNAESVQKVSHPTIETFLSSPAKANGASVIIFPGGGYTGLVMGREGSLMAAYFQDHGIAAFVVKYRLPSDEWMVDRTIGPLQDAQQAVRFVRQHAAAYHLDPARVGVMGFSAGGHLASTVATHFDKAYIPNPDNINLRPDFQVLVYPVVSMDPKIGHSGSSSALLGKHPSAEQIKLFSNDQNVTEKTPPALILHAADDHLVDVDNSIAFFEALRHHGVPVEMKLFQKGDHGFFLLTRDAWEELIPAWMTANGWMR